VQFPLLVFQAIQLVRGELTMRCPACQAENLDDAGACSACGTALVPRPSRRVRRGASDSALGDTSGKKKGLAWTAYRCSVVGLIPFVGLLLGPIAFALGFLAWSRGQGEPLQKGIGPALAGMLLGGLVALTNWLGLALMIYGLWSPWRS
jgi:hypothetical protein